MNADSEAARQTALDEAFQRLYADHQKRIYTYIGAFLLQPNDIDEVMQETSIILWRKFAQFEPGTNFDRWAYRIAYYEVLRFLRNRPPERLSLSEEALEALALDRQDLTGHLEQRRGALQECLQHLRPRDRLLIEQCYEPQATATAVAQEIGRPINAVHQSLARIRRVLHQCIDRAVAAQER